MQDIKTYFSKFQTIPLNTSAFKAQCVQITNAVQKGELTIVQCVECLGEYLVDKVTSKRAYGTTILSQILTNLPTDYLNKEQLSFICDFYRDRIKDNHEVIPPVLVGILAISGKANLPDNALVKLVGAIFQHIPCQQQQQNDRMMVYKIFAMMLQKNTNELKSMGVNFVYGVITAMDGEKHPINLLYLLKWLPTFLKNVNLGHLSEEMFDVISCYFPVDFRLSAEESNGITRESLANELKLCLTAIQAFGDSTVSLAMEKLDSALTIAKIDALELLITGCETFDRDVYLTHSMNLLFLLQKEIYLDGDPDVRRLCYRLLMTFTRFLTEETPTDVFKSNLNKFIENIKINLRLDAKLFTESTKIFACLIGSSPYVADLIIDETAPLLLNLYNLTTHVDEKLLILDVLVDFTSSYLSACNGKLLNKHFENLTNLLLINVGKEEIRLKSTSLHGIGLMARELDEKSRHLLYEYMKMLLIDCGSDEELKKSIRTCFLNFADAHPDDLNRLVAGICLNDVKNVEFYLKTLSMNVNFLIAALTIFINHFQIDAKAYLQIFVSILHENRSNQHLHEFASRSFFIERLLDYYFHADLKDYALLTDLATIFNNLIAHRSIDEQKMLHYEKSPQIITDWNKSGRLSAIFVLHGFITALRPGILLDFVAIERLEEVCFNSTQSEVTNQALELYAVIINKIENDPFITKTSDRLEELMKKPSTNRFEMIGYFAKALIMRNHNLQMRWIDNIMFLASTDRSAATCVKIILKDDYDVFDEQNHIRKRFLYQQHFFHVLCQHIENKSDNINYLQAFAHALSELKLDLIRFYLDKVVRLVILCMDNIEDSVSLVAILTLIRSLIIEKHSVALDYLEEFIPRLARFVDYKPDMNVRILAIDALKHYTNGFPVHKLQIYKNEVLSRLGNALDDHKRLVRKEAVDSRLLWFILNEPI